MISKQVVSVCVNLGLNPGFWSSLIGDYVVA